MADDTSTEAPDAGTISGTDNTTAQPQSLPYASQDDMADAGRAVAGLAPQGVQFPPDDVSGAVASATNDPAIEMTTGNDGAHLLPQYDALGQIGSLGGAARPLGPGEWVGNPDGSWSNEVTTSVQDPSLNGGRPTVVPTLWVVNGKPTRVTEDQAAQLAARSGLQFPAFGSMQQAEQFANQREASWQNVKPGDSGAQAPLWSLPADQGQPGSVAASASYRGAGGAAGTAPMFDQEEGRADALNAADEGLTATQLGALAQHTGEATDALRGEALAKAVEFQHAAAINEHLGNVLDGIAQEDAQARVRDRAEIARHIADYQSQIAAVRALALTSGNPYNSMSAGSAFGAGFAGFAEGFLAAQGIHINPSEQIEQWVDRSIAEHQQQVENLQGVANDQLHLYDIARQNSMDDSEARQRYIGYVTAGVQAHLQAAAAKYSAPAIVYRAQAVAAQMDADLVKIGMATTNGLQQRQEQRRRDAVAAATARARAALESDMFQAKQAGAAAKAAARASAGQNQLTPIAEDPATGKYRFVIDNTYPNKEVLADSSKKAGDEAQLYDIERDKLLKLKAEYPAAAAQYKRYGAEVAKWKDPKARQWASDLQQFRLDYDKAHAGLRGAGSSQLMDKMSAVMPTPGFLQLGENEDLIDALAGNLRDDHIAVMTHLPGVHYVPPGSPLEQQLGSAPDTSGFDVPVSTAASEARNPKQPTPHTETQDAAAMIQSHARNGVMYYGGDPDALVLKGGDARTSPAFLAYRSTNTGDGLSLRYEPYRAKYAGVDRLAAIAMGTTGADKDERNKAQRLLVNIAAGDEQSDPDIDSPKTVKSADAATRAYADRLTKVIVALHSHGLTVGKRHYTVADMFKPTITDDSVAAMHAMGGPYVTPDELPQVTGNADDVNE